MKGEVPHPSNKMENYKTEFTSVRKLKYKTKEIKQYFKQLSTIYIISRSFIYIFHFVVCFLLGYSRGLNFVCRSFGTLCLFHIHRHVVV